MAVVEARVDVRAPAARVWERLVDWPAHGRWIAFTRVTRLPGPLEGIGSRFVGRTGLGPVGFDDPMEVTAWQPPVGAAAGRCVVVKHGRVVLGDAEFEVAPRPDGGSSVTWIERVDLAPARLTRPFAPLVRIVGGFLFTRTLRAMAREIEHEIDAGTGRG